MHKISFTVTPDLCNKELIDLFVKVSQNSNSIFFGITSDIDNLGMYVAKYGRASGQNLVDFYTNIVGAFLTKQKHICSDSLVFIPAGEETSIFGYSTSHSEIEELFAELKNLFKSRSFPNDVIQCSDTSVSFGMYFYNLRELAKVKIFVEYYKYCNGNNCAVKYFELLKLLREKIAIEIDKEKFQNLNIDNSLVILVRNIIFSQLIDYKQNTMILLKKITPVLAKIYIKDSLQKKYGLNKSKYFQLKDKLNQITN